MTTKTYLAKREEVKRLWHEIDASGFTLGRLATRAAVLLRGKHKPTFTPFMDTGDFVVVTNAKKVKITGRKLDQKEYIRYSGYPGGIKRFKLREILEKNPERVIREAVRKMLAANRMRTLLLRRLKVVDGSQHNYKIDRKVES